ncbi:hypothetical protein Plhal304r1_c011g0044061 [Plasmopara halstedii]
MSIRLYPSSIDTLNALVCDRRVLLRLLNTSSFGMRSNVWTSLALLFIRL